MQDTIVIGEVLKPQGIRGELKVRPLLDDAADIKKFRRVFIEGREYKVLSARTDAQAAYLAALPTATRRRRTAANSSKRCAAKRRRLRKGGTTSSI